MTLSPLMFKEKLTMPKILGFLTVLVGIILVNGRMTADRLNTWGLLCGALSAVLFAALLLGEKMTAIQYLGAVCIIGGAMIGELVKPRKTNEHTN